MKRTPTSLGSKYAAQIRREFDVLLQATSGIGASSLIHTLAAEAVLKDTGTLRDSVGTAGYAWSPRVYENKRSTDPVAARIASAGASLGRILAGGHPTHRVYLAFLEAIYQVTVTQDDDVTERIQRLWDEFEAMGLLVEPPPPAPSRGFLRRLWARLTAWLAMYEPTSDPQSQAEDVDEDVA